MLFSSCAPAPSNSSEGTTSGAAFTQPTSIPEPIYDDPVALAGPSCSIDVSHAPQGYVGAQGTSDTRLKFVVVKGERSYNYDIPTDGSPIFCPINMGDGDYRFRVMKNTSGSNYVEILSTTNNVKLDSEFAPFLVSNVYCQYTSSSECVALAKELTAGAQNQGEALKAICTYITENISYDSAKASALSNSTGYIPNPDQTLKTRKGICFDYASLGCAMLRSQGIPCQIVTGYVSPNNIYHAWIMVYIDGTWTTAEFSIKSKEWSRVDLTFAAASNNTGQVGDGKTYTDRYIY